MPRMRLFPEGFEEGKSRFTHPQGFTYNLANGAELLLNARNGF
jgi:hypothetical protein